MKTILTISLIVLSTFTSLFTNTKPKEGKIIVYGIAYTKMCNSEVPSYYRYKIVDPKEETSGKKEIEAELKYHRPSALRYQVSSSSFDYGPSAGAMITYSFKKTENNCTYSVTMVQFGKDEDDAYERAVAKKNTWGGKNAYMTKIETVSF